MTTLAQSPTDDFNFLELIADPHTPLAKPFADRFRDACKADADAHAGEVNPNRVRALLLAEGDFSLREVRQFSALWSHAAKPNGYLDVPDRTNTVADRPECEHAQRGEGDPASAVVWVGGMTSHEVEFDQPRYCRRCDFYTDHVSTAHDGLAQRGLLRAKGEGLVVCADCGHQHTPDRCVGDPTPSDLWAGVIPASCDCTGPGPLSTLPGPSRATS